MARTLDQQIRLGAGERFREILVRQNRDDRAEFFLRQQIGLAGAFRRQQNQSGTRRNVYAGQRADITRGLADDILVKVAVGETTSRSF